MADQVTFPDTSEFQGVIDPAGQDVVAIRAYNGFREDRCFAGSRANAHKRGCQIILIYAYLVADRDAAEQAHELLAVVGTLAPNEVLIRDHEETQAGNDEQARAEAWDAVVAQTTSRHRAYSGLAFAAEHGLSVWWVAAYQSNRPNIPITSAWQFSDDYPWPWGRSDASVFAGTLPEFLQAVGITGGTTTDQTTSESTMEVDVFTDSDSVPTNGELVLTCPPTNTTGWGTGTALIACDHYASDTPIHLRAVTLVDGKWGTLGNGPQDIVIGPTAPGRWTLPAGTSELVVSRTDGTNSEQAPVRACLLVVTA